MKALFTLKPAIEKNAILAVAALLLAVPLVYPEIAYPGIAFAAQPDAGNRETALVFKIKSSEDLIAQKNLKSISFDSLVAADPLVSNLNDYLEKRQSPLAESSAKIITYPHWERALAISFVESHMCRFTPKYGTRNGIGESHNCSGIGGSNYRKYLSYEEWFSDMTALLNKPNYINRPLEKFIGYYVVPGSRNWLNGVKQIEAELEEIKGTSSEQRLAMTKNLVLAASQPQTELAKLK